MQITQVASLHVSGLSRGLSKIDRVNGSFTIPQLRDELRHRGFRNKKFQPGTKQRPFKHKKKKNET